MDAGRQEKELFARMKDHLEEGDSSAPSVYRRGGEACLRLHLPDPQAMIIILNIGEDQLRSPGLIG